MGTHYPKMIVVDVLILIRSVSQKSFHVCMTTKHSSSCSLSHKKTSFLFPKITQHYEGNI